MTKLSAAQKAVLKSMKPDKSKYLASYYPPTKILLQAGYIREIREGYYRITEAGEAAISSQD